jgi:hypothetical protein
MVCGVETRLIHHFRRAASFPQIKGEIASGEPTEPRWL